VEWSGALKHRIHSAAAQDPKTSRRGAPLHPVGCPSPPDSRPSCCSNGKGSPFGLPLGSLSARRIAESWELAKAGGDWQLLEEGIPCAAPRSACCNGGASHSGAQPPICVDMRVRHCAGGGPLSARGNCDQEPARADQPAARPSGRGVLERRKSCVMLDPGIRRPGRQIKRKIVAHSFQFLKKTRSRKSRTSAPATPRWRSYQMKQRVLKLEATTAKPSTSPP